MSRLFTKTATSEIDGISKKDREIASYFSVYGNRDHVGDIAHRGMFAKTIGPGSRLDRGLVPCKYNHELLVGKIVSAREESKGCLGVEKYGTDPQSDRIFGLRCDGMLPTASFKYGIPEGGSKMVREDGVSTRHLYEVELYEAGPVDPDLAANDATHVYGSKGLMELAGAFSSLHAVDCDEQWAVRMLESLTDEERAMIANLAGVLDKLGGAARSLMTGESGNTSSLLEESDDTYEGKALLQFAQSLESKAYDLHLDRALSTFSSLPALLKATG